MPSTSTSVLDGLSTSVAVKAPCHAVALVNITLSGEQTVNGVVCVEDDRVLCIAQTDSVDNGIYVVATGQWQRALDFDGQRDVVQGTRVLIHSATTAAFEYEVTTDNPIVIGTSAIDFVLRYGANATYDRTLSEIADSITPASTLFPENDDRRYGLTETTGSVRVKPTGFSYVTGNVLDCSGPGRAVHDFDAEAEFLKTYGATGGTGEFYVDPVNGSDLNAGSLNAPYQTLAAAFQNSSGLGVIWLLPGIHTTRFDARGSYNTVLGGTQARAVRIKARSGLGSVIFRMPGQQPGEMAWANTPAASTYDATPSGSQLALHMIFHEPDRDIQIQWYASAALADAQVSGWYQDPATKKIYVRHQNRNFTSPSEACRLELFYDSALAHICFGAKIFVQDVIFRGGNQFTASTEAGIRPIMYARRCKFQYLSYHNFESLGGLTLFQECTSEYSLGGDGFNYTDDGAQKCEAVEIDCIGRNNGVLQYKDFDGDRNKQGSTIHDTSVILRVNGVYEGNYAQNIADTGASSKTWMVGTICGSPYSDLSPGGIGGYYNLWTEGTAYLDNVTAGGKAATHGLFVQSGTARLYRCNFRGTTANIGGSGTTSLFHPAA